MGCGSSTNQVSDMHCEIFRPEKLLEGNLHVSNIDFAQGRVFIFGENRTERRIAEVLLQKMEVKSISKRTRIPRPRISYDPLELMYEESQQIFTPGFYGFSSLPPFNQMFVTFLQQNVLFLCGGVDYDEFNVKNQSFFYQIIDNNVQGKAQKREQSKAKSRFSNNKFERAAGMNIKRYGHQGIVFANNKEKQIFVFGGFDQNSKPMSSCERYSLVLNEWKTITPMRYPRANGFCLHFLGRLYLFGGITGQGKRSKKIEVYTPQQNQWEILNIKLHRGISSGLVFPSQNNEILIMGGNILGGALRSVIKVNIFEQTYVWDADMSLPKSQHKGLKFNEKIYVFGENDEDMCEVYDLKKKIWRKEELMHSKSLGVDTFGRFSFSTQSLNLQYDNAQIAENPQIKSQCKLLFGTDEYPCVLSFNPISKQIRKMQVPMTLRLRSQMGIVKITENEYFLCGGRDFNQTKSSKATYIYNSKTRKATQLMKMPQKKYDFGICFCNKKIFTFGGYSIETKATVKTCSSYDLEENAWKQICTLKNKRHGCSAQFIQKHQLILIVGGYQHNPSEFVKQVEIYNIIQNKMTTLQETIPITLNILAFRIKQFSQESCSLIIFNKNRDAQKYEKIDLTLKIQEDNAQYIQSQQSFQRVIHQSSKFKKPNVNQLQSFQQIQKPQFQVVQIVPPSQQSLNADQPSLTTINHNLPSDPTEYETNIVMIRPKSKEADIANDDEIVITQLNLPKIEQHIRESQQEQIENSQQQRSHQIKKLPEMKIAKLNKSQKQKISSTINSQSDVHIPYDRHYLIAKEGFNVYLLGEREFFKVNLEEDKEFKEQGYSFKKMELQGLKLSYLSQRDQ